MDILRVKNAHLPPPPGQKKNGNVVATTENETPVQAGLSSRLMGVNHSSIGHGGADSDDD
jgi:hypothetical protein